MINFQTAENEAGSLIVEVEEAREVASGYICVLFHVTTLCDLEGVELRSRLSRKEEFEVRQAER